MPELGPDLCYSCQEFLTLVESSELTLSDFQNETVMSFAADTIINTCQECNWVAFNKEGKISVTPTGRQIADLISRAQHSAAMRVQIASMVATYRWVWTSALSRGREEAIRRMPDDARQCFSECQALDIRWPKNLIQWWRVLSRDQRALQSDENVEVGLHAEELSFEFERKRTERRPIWRSLESESDGYDILSRQSKADRRPLRIEVKATSVKTSSAEFSITRNQWRTATASGDYVFHLWALGQKNILSIVDYRLIEPHVPRDNGKGAWQTFRVKFGIFFSDARRLVEFTHGGRLRTVVPKRVQEKLLRELS